MARYGINPMGMSYRDYLNPGGVLERDSGTRKCRCPEGGSITCINDTCDRCIMWACGVDGRPIRPQRETDNVLTHLRFSSGGNPNAIWSGAQTNVGPSDRIFAGNYASGRGRIRPMGGVQPTNPGERGMGGICACSCADGGGCVEFCEYDCTMCKGAMACRCCGEQGGPMGGARSLPGGGMPMQKKLSRRRGRFSGYSNVAGLQGNCPDGFVMNAAGVCVEKGLVDPMREEGCPRGQYRDRFGKCRSMQPGTYDARQVGGGCAPLCGTPPKCYPCGSTGPTYPERPGARQQPECVTDEDCGKGCFCRNGNCLCGQPQARLNRRRRR